MPSTGRDSVRAVASDLEYFERFYRLYEEDRRGTFRVHPLGELPIPGKPELLTWGEVTPATPVRFHRDQGTRIKDLIGTTTALLTLVSDRFVAVLREGGFSGWTTYPVGVYNEAGREVPSYHGLAITGRAGPRDNSLTPKELLPPPVPGGRAMPGRRGLLFKYGSWDGSSLFCPEGTAAITVTEEVRAALTAAKLSNLHLQRITEIERIFD